MKLSRPSLSACCLATILGAFLLAAFSPASAETTCKLNSPSGNIRHVIYIQFDNTHFQRDNPNVPSDLEQMPHLLNFIKHNGSLLANDHTVLISHTATGILSSLTGVYPDRMGQPISNSYKYFTPTGAVRTGVSFAYWTAPLFDPAPGATDFTPEMINELGKIAPAPWAPFTRAGCDFGAVATANTILENTSIDIPTVFGANSPEAAEVAANPGQAFADFVGIGVHCAQGSPICGASSHTRPDLLPDEPGSYDGFSGLFGATYVNPVIKPSGPMTDLAGNVIQDSTGHIGFPGFDGMEATVSLGYIAQMQEAGIPITYAYVSDAHDGHGISGNTHFAYGPGEAGYVQQLQAYDQAFQTFFDRLAADGITRRNTLFVFTVDEGDHFVGDAPTRAGCDGVITPCTYNRVGEINGDLRRMILTQFTDSNVFAVHSDDAPNTYVVGNPSQTDPAVRTLEREMSQLSWLNPYTGLVENNIIVAQADQTGMKALHMVTADPFRTPTFTPFADPSWFFFATGGAACVTPDACAFIPARTSQSFAWNHGDIQDEIASTWVGYVGQGVDDEGVDDDTWSDHTDVRPTILSLVGLKDDYVHDGRVIAEVMDGRSRPSAIRQSPSFSALARAYKQLNASFGRFAMGTLRASTKALASNDAGDGTYILLEAQIQSLTSQRDALATQIKGVLDAAEFGGQPFTTAQAAPLIAQANQLIAAARNIH